MELLITKCLKGYLKATKFPPIMQKNVNNFYHKLKSSLVQSHMLIQSEISFSVINVHFLNLQIQISLLWELNACSQRGITLWNMLFKIAPDHLVVFYEQKLLETNYLLLESPNEPKYKV